jgi:hypothetical protein
MSNEMENYKSISKMIYENSSLSLRLNFTDMSSGIKNFRTAAIFEPDPYEGEVANPESGLDQQYLHGPIRKKPGFYFRGKEINESLNLLERTCSGEKDLKETIQESSGYLKREAIHGYENPQGELDNWIFNNFKLEIQKQNDSLISTMSVFHFGALKDFILTTKHVQNVDEAISLYKNNLLESEILCDLQKGFLLQDRILKHTHWKSPDYNLLEKSGDIFNKEFTERYLYSLEKLKPFDITLETKNALLISMILKNFYKK